MRFSPPFAPSLSKPVLSDAAGGVEAGRLFFSAAVEEGQGFDKLSPNGVVGMSF